MSKVCSNAAEALKGKLKDDLTIIAGGFGLCGIPEHCIAAIEDSGAKNLTFVSNNAGVDDFGLGRLMHTRQIKKMISSYVGENKLFEQLYLDGDLELELNPQGTLAERIRAGGAGIPAFYTKTAYGTDLAKNKEIRVFEGENYVMERGIFGDIAIVKAQKGDKAGNLIFSKTARNFNPICATAAAYTVAEVEELVEIGELEPDQIHTAGIFVQKIFQGDNFEKRIEQETIRE